MAPLGAMAWAPQAPAWGSTNQLKLLNLCISLYNVITAITFRNKLCHTTHTFKQILYIKEIYQLELGKFMYKAHKGEILYKLEKEFQRLSTLQGHCTRLTSIKVNLS